MSDKCLICGKPVPDYEPKYCCFDYDCGCGGEAVNPCVCSSVCEDAIYQGIGTSFDERREKAGIAKWVEEQTQHVCPGCGCAIDPELCGCGELIEDHQLLCNNHSPVPMGCNCFRQAKEE